MANRTPDLQSAPSIYMTADRKKPEDHESRKNAPHWSHRDARHATRAVANCEARAMHEKDDATTIVARQDSPGDLANHCVGGPGMT